MSSSHSGWTSPTSSTPTLAPPLSPSEKRPSVLEGDIYDNPRIQASSVIEHIASRRKSSSTVYIYDVALQVGFGILTKAMSARDIAAAHVLDVQTRAGAGQGLVGRLSQGTSQDAVTGAVLTAYTTPNGLAMMAPSFAYLPVASLSSRLVLQVPTVSSAGEAMALSPSLAALSSVWSMLPRNIVVLLSSTPQQSVDFATLAYRLTTSHVIHLFDHYSSSREFGHSLLPLTDEQNKVSNIADMFRQAGYSFFDYAGDENAHTVIILVNGPLALTAKAAVSGTDGLGVVIVNVLRPWDDVALRCVLPTTLKNIHVLDDVSNSMLQGNLYADVFGALWDGTNNMTIHAHRVTPAQTQQYLTKKHSFLKFVHTIVPKFCEIPQAPSTFKKLLFMSASRSPLSSLVHVVEDLFLANKGISARLLPDYDALSKPGGIMASRLLLGTRSSAKEYLPIPIALPFDSSGVGEADFVGIMDHTLLRSHSILNYAKRGSLIFVIAPWAPAEYLANLAVEVASLVIEKQLHLYTIDVKTVAAQLVGDNDPVNEAMQNLIAHLAFLRLYLGAAAAENTVLDVARGASDGIVQGFSLEKVSSCAWSALKPVKIDSAPLLASAETRKSQLLKEFEFNDIATDPGEHEVIANGARVGTWHDAAKHVLFPSVYAPLHEKSLIAFPRNPALRPDVPDHTYLVTCAVNRRLTPLEYDRNVFHLEFDTSGTGLKYSIGEALGVHGWNDEQEVLDFCAWYGVNPHRLVTIPIPGDETKMHTRTVLQALQQQIDIFGRPPKSFYTDLAAFATKSVDSHALLFNGSPEGSATFKKLSEKDTVTYADILRSYPSARPGIETLCEMIGDIKPRHYSIASAQSVVGDRVDLLVVTVDWKTPEGVTRYGQCTRYLKNLKVGQKVTVSIKPSVMKLPLSPKQPIIMAGLGTGAAPFRAFLQHLAMLTEQGEEVGPVYYYFGSRHQASEYLYGEEIEAFILEGVITRAGLAFSRDGKKKVYIQHKMLEDSEALATMLHDQEGVFYLCGPTWPVPDVYEALVNALVKYKGTDSVQAGAYLESLKEQERYVLEVY